MNLAHPLHSWIPFGAVCQILLACASPAEALPITQQAYLKASNTGAGDYFGHWSVALSGDTAVIGAKYESSNATGVNGNQGNNLSENAGAAYVFVRDGTNWSQQAYLKASNTGAHDEFGFSVAISADTMVVGAPGEASNATGVNGDQSNNNLSMAGAAYVFVRNGATWSQQAYLKASNPRVFAQFGWAVSIAGDTVVIGGLTASAYVFVRSGTTWAQQAYLRASHPKPADEFGYAVTSSGDTVVISAKGDNSGASGINGNQADTNASRAGSAYVFVRDGTNWSQQAYLKASNANAGDVFGYRVAISDDTLVVSAVEEASAASGVNGNQSDNSKPYLSAAYVFARSGTNWSQQAYLKASNTGNTDFFGDGVGVSRDIVVVGATSESSNATGVNGNQSNTNAGGSGAAYVFVRRGTNWTQQAYLKASNTGAEDIFGRSVAVEGNTVLIGAPQEASNATGVNGNQFNNSASYSGAAYVFTGFCPLCPELTLTSDGANGYFIRYYGAPDLTYRLQRAPSVNGAWATIDTQTPPPSGFVEFHDNNLPPDGAFYRAVQP